MGIVDILKEKFSNSPEWKGMRFEKFILSKFDSRYFDLVEMTHSWNTNSDRYVESSLNPDFLFRYNPTGEEFAVECKFRSGLNSVGMIEWSNPKQFKRYIDYSNNAKIPVFVVIGFGGVDTDPDKLFVIPLVEIKYPSLYISVCKKYEKNARTNFFWSRGNLT